MRIVSFMTGLALLVCGGSRVQAGTSAPCQAGTRVVGGVSYQTYCGPARVTLHEGATRKVIAQGRCVRTRRSFEIDAGTHTQEGRSSRYWYFGTRVAPGVAMGDARFTGQQFNYQTPDGRSVKYFEATITLEGSRTRGSFSIPTYRYPGFRKVWGTFHCG